MFSCTIGSLLGRYDAEIDLGVIPKAMGGDQIGHNGNEGWALLSRRPKKRGIKEWMDRDDAIGWLFAD